MRLFHITVLTSSLHNSDNDVDGKDKEVTPFFQSSRTADTKKAMSHFVSVQANRCATADRQTKKKERRELLVVVANLTYLYVLQYVKLLIYLPSLNEHMTVPNAHMSQDIDKE